MRIGELEIRSGASRHTLRYYERIGLLQARRRANHYREYDEQAVAEMARKFGSRSKRIKRSASASMSPGAMRNPVCPSSIASGTPPTLFASTAPDRYIASNPMRSISRALSALIAPGITTHFSSNSARNRAERMWEGITPGPFEMASGFSGF